MQKINHILFVDEINSKDDSALQQAIELAQTHQAKMTVAGCYESLRKLGRDQPSGNLLLHEMLEHKYQELLQRVKPLADELKVEVKVFSGKPFLDIIREVIEYEVDMLIKPVEPSGFKTMLFGSQDLKLLRMCPCPVWLIKSAEQLGAKQILVAIDYEPDNQENEWLNKQLLNYGVSLALSQLAEFHVVHSWRLDNENLKRSARMDYSTKEVDLMLEEEQKKRKKWLQKTVDSCLSAHGKTTHKFLNPILHLTQGPAAFKIPELVEQLQPELLIMGTVGRTGIPGFLIGNTAEAVLFNIDCSVLAVKPEAFISPVKPE